METIKCKKYRTADSKKNYWDWYKENNSIAIQEKSKVVFPRTVDRFVDALIDLINNESKFYSSRTYFDVRMNSILSYFSPLDRQHTNIYKEIEDLYGIDIINRKISDILSFNFLQVLLSNFAEKLESRININCANYIVYTNYFDSNIFYNTSVIFFNNVHICKLLNFLAYNKRKIIILSEPLYCIDSGEKFKKRRYKNFRGHIYYYNIVYNNAQIIYCCEATKNYLYDYCQKKYEESKSMDKTEMLIFERMLNAFI